MPVPTKEPQYVWFCLEHIREYNAKWNALAGCSPQEIEAHIKLATVWERPTWPFGKGPLSTQKHRKANKTQEKSYPTEIMQAMAVMELEPPASLASVKKRYRALAKQFHPDLNGGKADTIAKFHALGRAYAKLKKFYGGNSARTNRK